jgi:3-oxoacyl-[acyl-carrier protein] reductase
MDLGLQGKVAFVAGALSAEGASVALCGRRLKLAEQEAATMPRAIGIELDLVDPRSVQRAASSVTDRLGPIDILILNGGGPRPSKAFALDMGDSREAAELLVHGPVTLVAQCLQGMRERKWGRVIAVGSSAVQQPISMLATSSMFRTALATYLKLLSEDVALDGVTVNMVLPGRIATARTDLLDGARAANQGRTLDDVRRESEASIPMGRYGRPDEFASVVAFLCGESASYLTGEQVRVDGGLVRAL